MAKYSEFLYVCVYLGILMMENVEIFPIVDKRNRMWYFMRYQISPNSAIVSFCGKASFYKSKSKFRV